jgi:hypothetical protein
VAFTGAPFELWDLKNLHPLRTMPRKFPPITALEWSPLHNLKSLKRKMKEEREKQVVSPTEGKRSIGVSNRRLFFLFDVRVFDVCVFDVCAFDVCFFSF